MHAQEIDPAAHNHSYRSVWTATVLQALSDIDTQPYNSIDYNASVSLFTARGEWAIWRAELAGYIDLHADDLEKAGRTRIAARHVKEPPAETLVLPVTRRPERKDQPRACPPNDSLPPAMQSAFQTPLPLALVETKEPRIRLEAEPRPPQVAWSDPPKRIPFNPMINRRPRVKAKRYG